MYVYSVYPAALNLSKVEKNGEISCLLTLKV